MKRFQFRLERVLHYLRQQELVQSGFVASIERDLLRKERERAVQIENQMRQEETIRTEHQQMGREALTIHYAHVEFLGKSIAQLAVQAQEIIDRLSLERNLLHEMIKRRRVVEELRSRKRIVYDNELERSERELLDEANSRRMPLPIASFEERR